MNNNTLEQTRGLLEQARSHIEMQRDDCAHKSDLLDSVADASGFTSGPFDRIPDAVKSLAAHRKELIKYGQVIIKSLGASNMAEAVRKLQDALDSADVLTKLKAELGEGSIESMLRGATEAIDCFKQIRKLLNMDYASAKAVLDRVRKLQADAIDATVDSLDKQKADDVTNAVDAMERIRVIIGKSFVSADEVVNQVRKLTQEGNTKTLFATNERMRHKLLMVKEELECNNVEKALQIIADD